ncbi:MAG TPA: hypothetical protein PLC38_02995 [Methanobacterium sp.]|nr:MAG: hypothetical protein FGO69_09355 [Methanobacterium sp.]HOI71235.1 hypothetical protein [Methanobacterium sp.]
MNLIQIKKQIDNGNNLIFYNKDVYKYYDGLVNDYLCIYFNEPLPVKVRLIECINKVSNRKRPSLKRQTMAELKNILVKELKYEKLVIIFNHFERLTKRSVQIYQYLNSLDNVRFICSFNKNFKPDVYPFFRTFELVNKEEYKLKCGSNEINITYTIYGIISVFCFFIYMKTASSLIMATILIGGAWFALIIFRTLMYAGGRS